MAGVTVLAAPLPAGRSSWNMRGGMDEHKLECPPCWFERHPSLLRCLLRCRALLY